MSDATIVSSTVMDALRASPYRKGRPSTNCPIMAMQTVRPAKNTARPEVLTAPTAASSSPAPARTALRCRVTMNRA